MNNALRTKAELAIIGWIDEGSTEEQLDAMYNEWYNCMVNDDLDGGANREMVHCSMTEDEWDEFLANEDKENALCAAEINLWVGRDVL